MKFQMKKLVNTFLICSIIVIPIVDLTSGFLPLYPRTPKIKNLDNQFSELNYNGEEEFSNFYEKNFNKTSTPPYNYQYYISNSMITGDCRFFNISRGIVFDNCFFTFTDFGFLYCSNIVIKNCVVENGHIWFNDGNNFTFKDNFVKGKLANLDANDANHVLFMDNQFYNIRKAFAIELTTTFNASVMRNVIKFCKNGIGTSFTQKTFIAENFITYTSNYGIYSSDTERDYIIDNKLHFNAQGAIHVDKPQYIKIENNAIRGYTLLNVIEWIHYVLLGFAWLWGIFLLFQYLYYLKLKKKLDIADRGEKSDIFQIKSNEETNIDKQPKYPKKGDIANNSFSWFISFCQILAILITLSYSIYFIYQYLYSDTFNDISFGLQPIRSDFFTIFISLILISLVNLSVLEYRTQWLRFINHVGNEGIRNLSYQDIFENHNRKQILDLILNEPGIHFSEIQRLLDLSPGNLQYHLNILLSARIIRSKQIGQYKVYFSYLKENAPNPVDLTLMKSDTTLDVYYQILDNPKITASAIAKNLDKPRNTVKYHVDKLLENEIINTEKRGRKKHLEVIQQIQISDH